VKIGEDLATDCSNVQGVDQEAFHIGFILGQFTKDPVNAPDNAFVHASQLETMGGIGAGSFASVVGKEMQLSRPIWA
jgi:hypothetical protein